MNITKILLIQTAFIGDVILVTPLIYSLKKLYPDSSIDVMVIPQCAKLLENNPSINKIISFDKKHKGFWEFLSFIKCLRKESYDISISPHSSFRSGLIPFLAGIKKRIGFKRYIQQFFLTHKIAHPKGMHKRLKNLRLLELICPPPTPPINVWGDLRCGINSSDRTHLYPTIQNYQKAQNLLESLPQNQKIILIAPGSVWFTKRWPLKNYTLLTQKLLAAGFNVILSGNSQERELTEQILNTPHSEIASREIQVSNLAKTLDEAKNIQSIDSQERELTEQILPPPHSEIASREVQVSNLAKTLGEAKNIQSIDSPERELTEQILNTPHSEIASREIQVSNLAKTLGEAKNIQSIDSQERELTEQILNHPHSEIASREIQVSNLAKTLGEAKNIQSIAGSFSLLDTAALIEKVDLVVCNDSGTLHIANAMQTPVFAFFGPTVKDIGYFPFNAKDFVFEVDLGCRPCGSHGGKKCPQGHLNCMEMISVETVYEKIISFFIR
ncbi:MAG: hypothetical protein FWG98_01225 [Candidatus Cloacimonetes bacterium]|nr:hypothetical protein [Candidatus Cloacimonadota bacterium]